ALPDASRRRLEGNRLPGGLRRRRARPVRAARRDGRPTLARGVVAPRAPRRRALRGRRAGRLLPDARRRRGARRADEELRRPPDAVRELDARLRAPAVGPDLRRRRARAPRRRSVEAGRAGRLARAERLRTRALRARPPPLAATGDRDRRPARQRRRARSARRLRSERGRRVRPLQQGAAPRGEDARRRPPGRLRVRAIRLPGARHGSRGARHTVVVALRLVSRSSTGRLLHRCTPTSRPTQVYTYITFADRRVTGSAWTAG